MDKKLGGLGASEVGKLFTKDGLKSRTVKTLLVEKAEEKINGFKKRITTAAMQHGLFNEEEAFKVVVKPNFENAEYRSDKSIFIFESELGNFWATPDIIDFANDLVIDVKCPSSIKNYKKYLENLDNKIIAQIQTQMLAADVSKGMVCVYLTSTRVDEWGNKVEYEIPLNERHAFIPIERDLEFQSETIHLVKEFYQMRAELDKMVEKAPRIDDFEFWDLIMKKGKNETKLKEKYNPLGWENKLVIYNNELIVIE